MKVPAASFWSGLCLVVIVVAGFGCHGRETPEAGLSGGVAVSNAVSAPPPPPPTAVPTPPPPAQPVPAKASVPEPANLNPDLREIAKLAKAGVNDSVMLAYVEKSTNRFTLSTDELIYLSDIGVAPAVITAMQRQTAVPQPAAAAIPPAPPTPPASGIASATPVPQATPETVTNVVTPNYVPNYTPPPTVTQAPAPTTVVVQQPVVVEQPASVAYFQDALGPYGSWVYVEGYGRCWRPDYAVLGSGWRPYADGGRWVWTDSGWYWLSDYPWGWATFHYGRWSHHSHHGWVWMPDTVWAPAWVCWRQNTSHCGWAPLPPGAFYRPASGWWYHERYVGMDFGFDIGFSYFTFIPWSRFCDPHPHHFYASQAHANNLYRESRVANNTVVGHNNSVVFSGVGLSSVRANTRAPIPQASLRESAWTAAGGAGRERLDQAQGNLVVQSPRLASAPPARPASIQGSGGKPALASPSSAGGSSGSTLTERDSAFRAGRTGFEPTAGSGSVFIPATRSTAPSPGPAAVSAPVASPATAAPAPVIPSARPPTAAQPASTPLPSAVAGAGGKRFTPAVPASPQPSAPTATAAPRPAIPPATLPPRVAGAGTPGAIQVPRTAPAAPAPAVTPARPPAAVSITPSASPARVFTPPPGAGGGTPVSRGFSPQMDRPTFTPRPTAPPSFTPPAAASAPAPRQAAPAAPAAAPSGSRGAPGRKDR